MLLGNIDDDLIPTIIDQTNLFKGALPLCLIGNWVRELAMLPVGLWVPSILHW